MLSLGPVGFTAPLLLGALILLPVIWFLLRAIPPAPIRRRFPGVALLLGLRDDDQQADKTPWWLLLLRTVAVAALILGFAGPVLNPQEPWAGQGPLLVLLDGTWADARDWPARQERVAAVLSEAGRAARPVAVVVLTDLPVGGAEFLPADVWAGRIAGLSPAAWEPDAEAVAEWAAALPEGGETYWLSDGLARDGRAPLLAALEARGPVTVFESPRPLLALRPAGFEDGEIHLTALRSPAADAASVTVTAHGPDPAGIERELARVNMAFAAGGAEARATLDLPTELRNRILRFQIEAQRSAAAVSLADDSLRQRKVALIAGAADREGLELLSPLHYLRQALDPVAELIESSLSDALLAAPDVIILADVARLGMADGDALHDWVERGGLLLRFAGPRLAASDLARTEEDPLLPVRLRAGGRAVGGTMSWGEPQGLRPFPEGSPFHGLAVPPDVTVSAQVVAQPDPALAERTIAALADGTPLVTRKPLGEGQVVLVHVTANAEWSSIPLSGLFVQMLERLAVSTRPAAPEAGDLSGVTWVADRVLDAFGGLADAGRMSGIDGALLAAGRPGPMMPPGLYAADDRRVALNVIASDTRLAPAQWPDRIQVEGMAEQAERGLKGVLLTLALGLFAIDVLAALAVSGRLGRGARTASVLLVLAALAWPAGPAQADEARAIEATRELVLAYVVTGDAQIDRVSEAGLRGLSRRLLERTSVEPAAPVAVDLETDELAFFPFLYWPVTEAQPIPSDRAYAQLNQFLRTGGMILFDTRDADVAGYGGGTPAGRHLQTLAAPLDIPPLEPLPDDHVLTRTFYLLSDFPGRHMGRGIWVEAAPADAEAVEGMPFRNLNDGVTPVVIGGNDWAAAWAIDDRGLPLLPVGRGYGGERQREMAYRFGINLIMYVLTGNYKSDQVHVPALLERLGQ
ncbi:DUF4159 domain-containing protein [Plastorhodobacter daqingensis]|uniref:DUF4159 domain-containing protein n=1 Tax=Plastorhodobacter daqingensis TaxID=1387281 RepID=A0ABW2UG94_9RHOB